MVMKIDDIAGGSGTGTGTTGVNGVPEGPDTAAITTQAQAVANNEVPAGAQSLIPGLPGFDFTSGTSGNQSNTSGPAGGVGPPEEDVPTSAGGGAQTDTTEPEETTETLKTPKEILQGNLLDPQGSLAASGLQQEAIHLTPQGDEFLDPTAFNIDATTIGPVSTAAVVATDVAQLPAAQQAQAAQDVLAQDYELSLLSPEEMAQNLSRLKDEEPMQAASMTDEMNTLLDGMENGEVPLWAKPAVTKVEQQLAARGLSASSIGRDSLFNAIIQSAMPIAQQNAAFKQDAAKVNYTAKVQAIFADVSAENSARQFNAASENQKNQFMTGLKAQLDGQNAARKDAMSQFNTAQTNDFAKTQAAFQQQANVATAAAVNQAAQFNAAQMNQASQFQANLDQQRNSFNSQQAAVIQQSNVSWRRQANQINTAIDNQVNQTNTQNAFNLSNQALSNLWQEERDAAHWEFQADQAALERRNRLEANVIANETGAAADKATWKANLLDGLGIIDELKSWL